MTKKRTINIRLEQPDDLAALERLRRLTGETAASRAFMVACRRWPAAQARIDELKAENRTLRQKCQRMVEAWEQYQGARRECVDAVTDLDPAPRAGPD